MVLGRIAASALQFFRAGRVRGASVTARASGTAEAGRRGIEAAKLTREITIKVAGTSIVLYLRHKIFMDQQGELNMDGDGVLVGAVYSDDQGNEFLFDGEDVARA